MTPDRPDQTPDDAEHGVLSDTGSIETTGLGILGGATEQVSVELPRRGPTTTSRMTTTSSATRSRSRSRPSSAAELPTETAEGEIVDAARSRADEWHEGARDC